MVEWLFQPTFQKNVRTFLEKSTDVFGEKYGRFWEKVRTFLGKSTDVLEKKYGRFQEKVRTFFWKRIIDS